MNIGIIVPHLGASQLAYLTLMYSNIGTTVTEDQFYVFFKNPSEPCIRPAFACLNISELAGFQGLIISTDFDSAEILSKVPTESIKVLYLWDLEFLRKKSNFIANMKILRDESLHIFCRSHEHARIIDNYANRLPEVVSQFNILELREKVTGEQYVIRR